MPSLLQASTVDTAHPTITAEVIASADTGSDARLGEIYASLVSHLHAFVREIEPTEKEWFTAIQFLTRTGQICDGKRQEFILLSDVLGVSMLVDAINHRFSPTATESTVFGPFYSGEQPELPAGSSILRREEEGERLLLEGRIVSAGGEPIPNTKIEVWQTAPNGRYDVQDEHQPEGHLRATFRAADDGSYGFSTVMPVSYPIPHDGPVGWMLAALKRHPYRPAHIHFMVSAPGFRRLVTHLFIAGDPYLQSDAVFGVKGSLIVNPTRGNDGVPTIYYDFRLEPEA